MSIDLAKLRRPAWVGNLGSHAFATTAAPVAVKVGCMEVNESLTQLLLAHFEHNAPHAQTGADVTMGCEILAFANLHPIYDGNQMRCDYRAAST